MVDDPDDPVHVLQCMCTGNVDLWKDQSVRERLYEKRVRLEESSGL